jgi:hypothetical protein
MAVSKEGLSSIVHPAHAMFAGQWRTARDLYEGTGGFLDEARPYLIPHPREWLDHSVKDETSGKWSPNPTPRQPSAKLTTRRKLARYENWAATILDGVAGALFLQSPTRTFGAGKENPKIAAWWENVDGQGKDMTAYMRESWVMTGVFGHVVELLEKAPEQAPTAADQGLPYLCRYTPLDVLDWLEDEDGKLSAVKLAELAPRTSFDQRFGTRDQIRVRIVDKDGWRLYGPKGELVAGDTGSGDHGFGVLPVEYIYAKRRLLTRHIGKPIMGDPQLYIDAYNLVSEVRELLRNQTFAILNIPIGPEGSVESEMLKVGNQSGSQTALFSSLPADYISPSADNVTVYHEHMDRLARTIYRLASAPWEGDSKDVESADSRKIKRNEYEQILKTYAAELQGSEMRLLKLAYMAIEGDQWEAKWEADQPSVTYPQTFQPVDMKDVLDNAVAAIGLDLGETLMKELKKKVARKMLPDAQKGTIATIDEEIDALKYVSEEDKRQEEMDQAAKKFAGRAAA